jgi:Xaa-Pro dipeptidase
MSEQPDGRASSGYPFAVEEFKARLTKVRMQMRSRNIDLLLVTAPENIYYLTGYRTTGYYINQALAVPLDGDPKFVVRKFEFSNVESLSWIKGGVRVDDTASYLDALTGCLDEIGGTRARIGFDEHGFFLPVGILDGLRSALKQASFVPAAGVVESCRMLKSPAEIDYIRRACGVAVAGIEAGIAAIRPGRTENDVAGQVYAAMAAAGGEYPSSQPYVVVGPRSALGHASFERNEIKSGELVYMEVGGCWLRYGGAIMRTVSVGAPSAELRKAADVMLAALAAVLEAAGPGVASGDVDRAGRSVVEKAGLGKYWLHRTGYSIGIGFPPGWGEGHIIDLKRNDQRRLEPGMTFHTVPLVLLPGLGAVGFSETWAVTDRGIDVLTKTERKLHVL